MSKPQQFRKKPVVVEAMQWDRTEATLEVIVDWTDHVIKADSDGRKLTIAEQFLLVLSGWDDAAQDILGEEDTLDRARSGHDAVIYNRLHGTWVNVANGDWIIKGGEDDFYPCSADVFAATYEPAQ